MNISKLFKIVMVQFLALYLLLKWNSPDSDERHFTFEIAVGAKVGESPII